MKYLDYVNIKHGTESVPRFSNGNTLPQVQVPFGMNAYVPQTDGNKGGWFYHPKDRSLEGIRITHRPSPWIGDYTPLIMMPQREKPFLSQNMRWSGFRPENADLKPDYLKVDFLRYRTIFELAPTTRGGIVRMNYEGEDAASLLLTGDKGNSEFVVDFEKNAVLCTTRYTSWECVDNFAMYTVCHFESQIDKTRTYILHKNEDTERGSYIKEEDCGISVGLCEKNVVMRFATSFIDFEQAWKNLEEEVIGKDFEQIHKEAADVWEHYLSKIEIETDNEEQLRLFYSCMYRLFLFPTKFYEINANGNPVHFCADTGVIKSGIKYVNNGFWDTFRTVYPLFSLIAPDEFAEILEGFVNTYKDCGWLPKWPSPNEVGMMPGTLIDAVIAEAAVKGIGSETLIRDAFEGMMKHATEMSDKVQYGRKGVSDYNKYGYLPHECYHESVSNSLDFVYGDFCISQVAKILGCEEISQERYLQSKNYVKLFDKETGFMRGRDKAGEMHPKFNEFSWGGEYCEGGPWQSSFAVYHDIEGLAELYGGKEQLIKKIDCLFETKPYYNNGGYANEIHEMTEMAAVDFGQCAISNQPSFHIPYIYAALGEKEKTEYWVSHFLNNGFSSQDDGFPGDEDNGTMAAWVIFSMIGLYPMCPGKPEYIKIKPQVKKAVVHTKNRDYYIGNDDCEKVIISHKEIVDL